MKFHHKIILAALSFTLIVAGAKAYTGAEGSDLVDPGFWAAMGEELIGVEESGWCKCS